MNDSSNVVLSGEIITNPEKSHISHGEWFYNFYISVKRKSGAIDILPCITAELLVRDLEKGKKLTISGEIRTYNTYSSDGKRHVTLKVFVNEIMDYFGEDLNTVELNGYLCRKKPIRITGTGREISEIILAVNREKFSKSDYINALAWGRNAKRIEECEIGKRIATAGRLQSRIYIKKFEDGTQETHTTYEVSLNSNPIRIKEC